MVLCSIAKASSDSGGTRSPLDSPRNGTKRRPEGNGTGNGDEQDGLTHSPGDGSLNARGLDPSAGVARDQPLQGGGELIAGVEGDVQHRHEVRGRIHDAEHNWKGEMPGTTDGARG